MPCTGGCGPWAGLLENRAGVGCVRLPDPQWGLLPWQLENVWENGGYLCSEAKSWIMFSDLVNVQGYLRPDIIFGVKPLSFVNTYQPPSFPAHETVCPESGLPMVTGEKAAGV